MDVGNHRIVPNECLEPIHGHVGVPEFVETLFDGLRGAFVDRRLVRRPEGTPADVFVGLIENVFSDVVRLLLRVLRDDRPASQDHVAVRRRLAVTLERLAIRVQSQTARRQESVGDPGHAIDGRRRHATEQHLRGMLRYRCHAQVSHLEALALEVHGLTGPGATDDLDTLFDQAGPMGDLALELFELELSITNADTQVEAAAAQQRQRRGVFRDADRVGDGEQHEVGAHVHRFRTRRDVGADDEGRRGISVVAEMMLRQPAGAEAEVLGARNLVEALRIERLEGLAPWPGISKVIPETVSHLVAHAHASFLLR